MSFGLSLTGPRPSIRLIDEIVARALGPTRVADRCQPAVRNRQIAMYLAKKVGGWSTTMIGKYYNGRDHSTVCHSIARICSLKQVDPLLREFLDCLTGQIGEAVREAESSSRAEHMACLGRPMLDWDDLLVDAIADRIAAKVCERLRRIEPSTARIS